MKKVILTQLLIASTFSLAQNVGINTSEPSRTLDINGNLKITTLTDRDTQATEFSELLVTDNNGNVEKINIPSLEQSNVNNVEVTRTNYIATAPDQTKECSCGDFTFRINNSRIPEIKLNSNSPLTNQNASSFTFGYGVKTWSGTSYTYADRKDTTGLTFNTANFSTYKALDSNDITTNNDTIKIYTIILPGQNNLYRLTISGLKNSSTQNIYSLICEKFYIQSI